jgi:hypothetical protein
MPRVYELPTHLQVEDHLIAGLTTRQLLRLVVGGSLAYGAWDQLLWLPDTPRLALAGCLAALGAIFALLQPFDRSLDQWLVAGVLFLVLPRRLRWQPGPLLPERPADEPSGWAELEVRPEWSAEPMTAELSGPSVHPRSQTGTNA